MIQGGGAQHQPRHTLAWLVQTVCMHCAPTSLPFAAWSRNVGLKLQGCGMFSPGIRLPANQSLTHLQMMLACVVAVQQVLQQLCSRYVRGVQQL